MDRNRKFFGPLVIILLVFCPLTAGQKDRRADVLGVRYNVYPGYTRVVMDLASVREFTHGEARTEGGFYVDVLQARTRLERDKSYGRIGSGYIKSYSLTQKSQSTVRLFLNVDFAGVKEVRVYPLKNPFRLVVDIFPATAPGGAEPTAGRGSPPTAQAPGMPAPKLPPGYSMSRQLGLGVRTIVIDPGHGGAQPGCIGKSGLQEKQLTLALALGLKDKLSAAGYNVLLTRYKDETVSLAERTAFANRNKADLCVSIHVNAHVDRRREGIETFFLNFSPDPTAMETAARENSGADAGIGRMPEIIKKIAQNDKIAESRALAESIQKDLLKSVAAMEPKVKNLGVKAGPFWVLIGGEMPSVLVEVAHLSNPGEEKLLQQQAYLDLIVQGLFQGIMEYISSLGKG